MRGFWCIVGIKALALLLISLRIFLTTSWKQKQYVQIIFLTPVLNSQGRKMCYAEKYIRKQAGMVFTPQSSLTKLSRSRIPLKRWIRTESRWHKKIWLLLFCVKVLNIYTLQTVRRTNRKFHIVFQLVPHFLHSSTLKLIRSRSLHGVIFACWKWWIWSMHTKYL